MSTVIIKSDINKMLYGILGNMNSVESWWHSENINFNLYTPEDIYHSGDAGRKLVYDLVSIHVNKNIDHTVFQQNVKAFLKGKK